MLHPETARALVRAHHEDLLREANEARLAKTVRSSAPMGDGAGTRLLRFATAMAIAIAAVVNFPPIDL